MPEYRLPPWGRSAPPAPLATVVIHGKLLGRDVAQPVRVLLDSGADYTEVPLGVAQRLLKRASERHIDGRLEPDPTYYARIELEGRIFEIVAIGSDEFNVNGEVWGLIGRDILNEAVVLDGPRHLYEVMSASG